MTRCLAARRLSSVAAAVLVLLTLTACEVRTEVNLTVEDDGSGVVEVAVGLDDEAARRLEALGELDFSDLVASGWEVSSLRPEDDGRSWLRVRHSFANPSEIGALVEQIAGDQILRDFTVRRQDAFAESTWEFSGIVDFAEGTASVADPEIDAALADAGVTADALTLISERLDAVKDEQLRFQVAVRLPGSVTSNAPTRASNGAIWQPSITDRAVIELRAQGVVTRSDRIVWLAVGVLAGLALVLFLSVRLAVFVRRRRSERSATLA